MFAIKDWEAGFLWVEFKEHPYVDIRENKEVNEFDVSTKHYPDYAPDFKKDNSFDHKHYCICLLRTTLDLSMDGMMKFLAHQSDLMEDPLEWLFKFEELLEIADEFEPTKPCKIRFKRMRTLINDQCDKLLEAGVLDKTVEWFPGSNYSNESKGKYDIMSLVEAMENKDNSYTDQVSIFKQRRKNYLKEVKNADKKDDFIRFIDIELVRLKELVFKRSKLIPFSGTAIKLADIYIQYFLIKEKKVSLDNINNTTEADRACNIFCDKVGDAFKSDTIRTNLGKSIRRIMKNKEK